MLCKQCQEREVEDERESWATPVCFACVPPPKPLPVVVINVERLSTGYLRAQGPGPCNWAQWPETREVEDGDFFPEASEGFRRRLREHLATTARR